MNTAAAPRPARPIRLYHHPLSGHVHRVELFLALLDLPYEIVPIDVFKRETREPAFLSINPFGQVPVIADGELTLADSNAILVYLAKRYDATRRWMPDDAVGAARVQRWFSIAAGPLAAGPASARVAMLVGGAPALPQVRDSHRLFGLMDAQLASSPFLAGAAPTLADVSLYSYTAHAPEGGVSLEPYPRVREWLSRIEALPRFKGMQRSRVPEPVDAAALSA